MKDVRELSASDEALEGAARSARCAAFATAAACIAATQEKEGLFANPLKTPHKPADPAGDLYMPSLCFLLGPTLMNDHHDAAQVGMWQIESFASDC